MARVRLLQTSDVHLRQDRPERAHALGALFELARTRSADALLVCGDLFDRTADAVGQRAVVRQLVESIAPRPVVFLPGNHDQDSYGADTDLGANAVVLTETPVARTAVCGIDVIGVPYQHGRTLAECLTGVRSDPRHTVLMAHGTILDGVADAFAGEGEDGAYLPIFLSDVLKRGCYAALGHLHAGANLIHRDQERLVAYAGSPVATSPLEIGPRSALLVDFEPGAGVLAHETVRIPTPFYESVRVLCRPGREETAVEELAREALAKKSPGARVVARLEGVSLAAEADLKEAAERALSRAFAGASAPAPSTLSTDPGDPEASLPLLDFAVASYPALSDLAIVGEFIERVETRARDEGESDSAAVEAALRLGFDAFLEALP